MIDLSEDSARALKEAAKRAEEKQAKLVVIYSYRLKNQHVGEAKSSVNIKQRLERDAYDRFDKMRDRVKELDDVPYTFSAEVGFETDRLEAHLKDKNIHSIYLCKAIADQAEHNNEWRELMHELKIPLVFIS